MKAMMMVGIVATVAAADPRTDATARIAAARRGKPVRALTKREVRDTLHAIVPRFQACGRVRGVVNSKLTIDSEPGIGTVVTVRGFATTGTIPDAFLACVRAGWQARVAPAIGGGGHLDMIYPTTFGLTPVDNHDLVAYAEAQRTVAAGDWTRALAAAERGLEDVTLDGPHRRALIEIAGIAACRVKDAAKAAFYIELASPDAEPKVRAACATSS